MGEYGVYIEGSFTLSLSGHVTSCHTYIYIAAFTNARVDIVFFILFFFFFTVLFL